MVKRPCNPLSDHPFEVQADAPLVMIVGYTLEGSYAVQYLVVLAEILWTDLVVLRRSRPVDVEITVKANNEVVRLENEVVNVKLGPLGHSRCRVATRFGFFGHLGSINLSV